MSKRALIISGVLWNAAYQRHHLNAHVLCDAGFEVDFIEGCKTSRFTLLKLFNHIFIKIKNTITRKAGNKLINNKNIRIRTLNSALLPPGGLLIGILNRVIFYFTIGKKLRNDYDVILVYVPTDHIKFIKVDNSLIVYDCVRAFSKWGGYHRALYKNEIDLLNIADKIMCDSYYLKNIHLPSMLDGIVVDHIMPPAEVPLRGASPSVTTINRIGYFGSISEHIDTNIFKSLINSGYEVFFWGLDDDNLLPDSVVNMGYVSGQEALLDSIIAECDAIIIPYIRELDGVFPAKLSLSLASGLPVFCSKFYDATLLSDMLYVYNDFNGLHKLLTQYSLQSHISKYHASKLFLEKSNLKVYKRKILDLIDETYD
ncbi:hypothetical protein VXM60_13270 [Shewanella khirikhana]|uniref:glycosyltransferase n=1 Tax=Shewanella khirikhana TaxID=1965282 RepID=UPI0030CB1E5F